MPKDAPHGRSANGRDYVCGNCGAAIPDGALVLAHWTGSGKVSGVKVTNLDGTVLHECGTKLSKGEGENDG